MTLKEIAAIAKVSPSTISRVINNNDEKCASKDVRDRIWKIIRETGYIPNRTAQKLKMGTAKKDAGVRVLTGIFARVNDFNDQFFSKLYRIIEQEAFKQGFIIQHIFSFTQLEGYGGRVMLENAQADGAVILGRCSMKLMQLLKDRYQNIISIALNAHDFPVDRVICDGYNAAREAVRYLHSLGHHAIGYIGERKSETRYRGYCDEMQELKLHVREDYIIDVIHSMDGGYNGALLLLDNAERPTSIFCCNDITAVGAIRAIKEKGLQIPSDISVIGIDNIEMAEYVTPMLTTIGVPLEEMGKLAVKLLVDRITQGHSLPIKADLPFNLIKRESCGVLTTDYTSNLVLR